MMAKVVTNSQAEDDWVLRECGSELLTDVQPCFSKDNRLVFCGSGPYVHIAEQSGKLCGRLVHRKNVIGVQLHPFNSNQLVTCQNDGTVTIWNIDTAECTRSFQIKEFLESSVFFITSGSVPLCFLTGRRTTKFQNSLISTPFPVECEPSSSQSTPSLRIKDYSLEYLPSDSRHISFGHEFLAYASGKVLRGCRYLDSTSQTCYHNLSRDGTRCFTSVSCHPGKDQLAAGDSTGRILVWYNTKESLRSPAQIIHWQTFPVVDLWWSPEGSAVWSGGRERVLVKYTLFRQGKWHREFLPRLGGAIVRVSGSDDGSTIAIATTDNTVQVVSSQMAVLGAVEGLIKGLPIRGVGLHLDRHGAAGDQTAGCLWTNGRAGQLQCFRPDFGGHVFSLDVTGLNMPPEEPHASATACEVTDVVRVALGSRCLATLEYGRDVVLSDECNLKFWLFDEQISKFELITCIEHPHKDDVTDLAICQQPGETPIFVTTGIDGKFKVWSMVDESSIYNDAFTFACTQAGMYQNQPASCASFSLDGSVLAVGFGPVLSLWDAESGNFSRLAAYPPSQLNNDDEIREVVWCWGGVCLCRTDGGIWAWDPIESRYLWGIPEVFNAVCTDQYTQLAAAINQSFVCLFYPKDGKKMLSMETPSHLATSVVQSAAFYPLLKRTPREINLTDDLLSRLCILTSDKRLFFLCKTDEVPKTFRATAEEEMQTPFSELLNRKDVAAQDLKRTPLLQDTKSCIKLLSGPAHSLPSIDVIGPAFIRSCLRVKVKPN